MSFLKSFFQACRTPRRRLPLLRSDAAGAAQACLAMLATRYSQLAPGQVAASASLADMMRALGAAGLACRLRSLAQAGTAALRPPCILSWDGPDYVVLAALGDGWATLHDPVHGLLRLPLASLRARSRGAALECLGQGHKTRPAGRPAARPPSLPRHAWLRLLALALAAECLALAAPALLWVLVDAMLVGGDYSWLPLLAIFAGLALPLYGAVRAAHGLVLQPLLASMAYVRALRAARTDAAAAPLPDAARVAAPPALLACLPAIVLLGALQPRLLVLVLGVCALYVLMRRHARVRLAALRREALRSAMQCSQQSGSARASNELMARFGRRSEARRHRQALAMAALAASMACRRAANSARTWQAALAGWLVASVLMVTGAAVQSGSLTAGAALGYAWLCAWLAWRIACLLDACMDKVPDAGEQRPASMSATARARAESAEVFEARQLGFRFPGAPAPCVQNLDLRIAAGEAVLLCGAGGAGKTTLCRLLAGQLTPTTGQLFWPPAAAQAAVIAMYADDRLLAGSIAQNLCLFDALPSPARMDACLRMAGAHAAVGALPKALDTVLEEGGAPLPQSLRQRLLVARALYARPAVLLLDDATSALSTAEELELLGALTAAGIACLVASRRLEARSGELPMRTLRLSA